ncbi:rRNA pseudouridine synthase [Patescibacteria group bacterium]|nr:rRNA pseudouridine synthase [Patescibacteria group bacterium]
MEERLQKFMSRAGFCSRRKAEVLIREKKVKVNGTIAQIGEKINPNTDQVECEGKQLTIKDELIYIALNKPKGYTSTKADPHAQKTVYELLPEDIRSRVHSIGRLDKDTEGLLLFTNDGNLTEKITHPRYNHEKEYEVIIAGNPSKKELHLLEAGVDIGDKITAPAKVVAVHTQSEKTKVNLVIHEGAKRQIRRMFKGIRYPVLELKRVRIGKLKLKGIPLGKWKNISKKLILDSLQSS